jgi:hypothetical protein
MMQVHAIWSMLASAIWDNFGEEAGNDEEFEDFCVRKSEVEG